MTSPHYCGRFAPSPTGPLHFGSLVTALASFLEADRHQGTWLVRIEDLDPLRESQEAVDRILTSLDAHHLHTATPIRFQSQRHDAYQAVIERLLATGQAYRCPCSRKELQANNGHHSERCRHREAIPAGTPFAVRFALRDAVAEWQDRLLGYQKLTVRAELEDPVIQRKEGFYAYQLAVVVDDIDQGITDIVRGSDLLATTGHQQQLYQALDASWPSWFHIPVILNQAGQKLSKQTHAPALDDRQPADNLVRALTALGQQPPANLAKGNVTTVLDWARAHWQPDRLPRDSQCEQHPTPPQRHD